MTSSETAGVSRSWEPMELTYVGEIGEVLQGGIGKLSPPTNDTGDTRKPRGQE